MYIFCDFLIDCIMAVLIYLTKPNLQNFYVIRPLQKEGVLNDLLDIMCLRLNEQEITVSVLHMLSRIIFYAEMLCVGVCVYILITNFLPHFQ